MFFRKVDFTVCIRLTFSCIANVQVGFKEKLAVALFSTRLEAQACVRDHEDHGTLGEGVKVCYLIFIPWLSPKTRTLNSFTC